jgi:phosphoribosylanthranilate isomerase
MQVKICGMTRIEDALAAAQFGADYVGLILAPSLRRVTASFAADVVRELPASTQPVLVFRDAPLQDVLAAVEATGCTWVQLHGHESPAYRRDLADRLPNLHVIKTLEIGVSDDPTTAGVRWQSDAAVPPAIDVLLLDKPKSGQYAGHDRCAAAARRFVARPPWVWLAGGLRPENVAQAVASGGFDGVDVAGGVESEPGVKDHDAMRQFIEAVRRA